MALTLDEVVLRSDEYDPVTVAEPWIWRLGPGYTVLMPTVLGHLFLRDAEERIWFLDMWKVTCYTCLRTTTNSKCLLLRKPTFSARVHG